MTEYALAPNRKFTAASPYRTPRVMLEQGLLNAYRVRANGTMRHLELCPLGSTMRDAAEWVSDAVDVDGRSVQSVGRELNVSAATVRRYLESLELTEEIENDEWSDLSFDDQGNPVWVAGAELEEGSFGEDEWTPGDEIMDLLDNPPTVAEMITATNTDEPVAPRTRSGRKCTVCGKAVTARNSAAKVHRALGYEDMCVPCYDLAGWENTHSDNGHGPTNRKADCLVCQAETAQATKDAELLARNQARFAPKATQDAVVPGAQCEPEGTTADELAATLAASVAQVAPVATTPLVMCFCGDQGVHAPGAVGCKHVAVAIPRRTRSH